MSKSKITDEHKDPTSFLLWRAYNIAIGIGKYEK